MAVPTKPAPLTSARVATSTAARAAGACLVVSSGLAVWAWGRDRGPTDPWDDYLLEPPTLDPGLGTALAWVAPALAIVSLVVLVRAWRHRRLRRSGAWTIAILVVAAVLAAGGLLVVTAGTTGSNIGGGLVLLAAPVLLVGTVAAVAAVQLADRSAQRRAATMAGDL